MFINTSTILPSLLARYLSNRHDEDDHTNSNNVSSNNSDIKIISNNCLSYNGYLLYIIDCYEDVDFRRGMIGYISFDDFILNLFEYCLSHNEEYEKELHDMLNSLFKNRSLRYDGHLYRLLII